MSELFAELSVEACSTPVTARRSLDYGPNCGATQLHDYLSRRFDVTGIK